jgi:hypothetical protein
MVSTDSVPPMFLYRCKQHLKDSVRSNKRAFEQTGVEEIDSEDSLGVGMTQ